MSDSSGFQPYFDELVAFATHAARKDELLAARKEFFELTGAIFEDATQFEPREAALLDDFIFDRPPPPGVPEAGVPARAGRCAAGRGATGRSRRRGAGSTESAASSVGSWTSR